MSEVVVGIDHRPGSRAVLARALDEAERRGARLRVVHVWQSPMWVGGVPGLAVDVAPGSEESEACARGTLTEVVHAVMSGRSFPPPVAVEQELRHGAVDRELLAAARGADLVVVGGRSHGLLTNVLLGSATSALLHKAPCPVMVLPDPSPPVSPWTRVVVGLDGSAGSRAALAFAFDVARRDGVPLVAIHAWMVTTMPAPAASATSAGETGSAAEAWVRSEVARNLPDRAGVDVRLLPVHGSASAALLDTAGSADLLVIGARGSGGFAGLLVGSVASQCARRAHGALVVVRGT